MSRVVEILERKGRRVHTIDAHATVYEAIRKMVDENVGSLIVMNGDSIAGIFTERDYLRRIALEGRTSKNTRVVEVATERLVVVEPSRAIEDCMALMTRERIRHLPVIEAGRIAGIVSIGDLVKFMAADREAEIRHLTDYITGRYPG